MEKRFKPEKSPQYSMGMKASAVFCAILAVVLIVAVLPSLAYAGTSLGVKKGDWIEYSISMTGPPLDQLRNLTWYRMEILSVEGELVQVNKTSQSVNGTFSSSLWNFDLTGGKTYGWVIIPANLSVGESFFDSEKGVNVTVEGEEEKTLLGASRDITRASDPPRVYKEWDKSTGVYVYSLDHTTDYTVTMTAVATNLWGDEASGQNREPDIQLIALAVLIVFLVITALLLFCIKRRNIKGCRNKIAFIADKAINVINC